MIVNFESVNERKFRKALTFESIYAFKTGLKVN